MLNTLHEPQSVLNLWFPDTGHQKSMESHGAFWEERMQGGMDATIIANFAEMTLAAATGHLDHWADTPRGRLALLIVRSMTGSSASMRSRWSGPSQWEMAI